MGIYENWLATQQQRNPQPARQGYSTQYTPGAPGKPASQWDVGYSATPATAHQVYNGAGGQWTQGAGGWSNASGQTVNDLEGYLKMKEQQRQGSDFSGYQNQLNDALAHQSQANSDYQALLHDPSKIQETAGYKFALDQGNQAINRSAAAKGSLNSGNVLAELAKYSQGMASQQYETQLGNYNQNLQNQNAQANSLASLMSGAQNFGLQSGYYQTPQNDNQPNARRRPSTW